MPNYSYIAIGETGVEESGSYEATSDFDVVQMLQSQNLIPLEISEVSHERKSRFSWLPVTTNDRCLLLRQMAMMSRAGITLPAILPNIRSNTEKKAIKSALSEISNRLQSGSSLSQAMRAQPKLFSPITCGVVESSETSGSIDQAFERMATAMEFWHQVRTKVIESLIYPVVVFLVALLVSYLMFFNFIPELEKFLSASGRPLPAFTKTIFNFASFIRSSIWWILSGTAALSLATFLTFRNENGRRFLEKTIMRIPLFGKLILYSELSMISSCLHNLLDSGSSLLNSLQTIRGTLKSRLYQDWMDRLRKRLMTGEALGDSLDPLLVPQSAFAVIRTGDASGSLANAFAELERYFSTRLEARVKLIVSLVEPALLIVVGAIVGSVYLAMFLAIISINV